MMDTSSDTDNDWDTTTLKVNSCIRTGRREQYEVVKSVQSTPDECTSVKCETWVQIQLEIFQTLWAFALACLQCQVGTGAFLLQQKYFKWFHLESHSGSTHQTLNPEGRIHDFSLLVSIMLLPWFFGFRLQIHRHPNVNLAYWLTRHTIYLIIFLL